MNKINFKNKDILKMFIEDSEDITKIKSFYLIEKMYNGELIFNEEEITTLINQLYIVNNKYFKDVLIFAKYYYKNLELSLIYNEIDDEENEAVVFSSMKNLYINIWFYSINDQNKGILLV